VTNSWKNNIPRWPIRKSKKFLGDANISLAFPFILMTVARLAHVGRKYVNCMLKSHCCGSSDRSFLPFCDAHLSETDYQKEKSLIKNDKVNVRKLN